MTFTSSGGLRRHLVEQTLDLCCEQLWRLSSGLNEPLKEAAWKQCHVLGEEAEEQLRKEVGDSVRLVAAPARTEPLGQCGEPACHVLGDLRTRLLRLQRLWIFHRCAKQTQRLGRRIQKIIQREIVDDLPRTGEVRVDLESVQIAHDEQGRILQRLPVLQQLLVRVGKVRALLLVLPREAIPLPDVGESLPSFLLLGALLECVPFAGWVRLVGCRYTDHPAEVDEVLLRGGALGTR